MLPFSRIACVQCRQFAIRSFASAVAASTPSTSSNPAPAPPATPLDVEHTASTQVDNGDENTSQDYAPTIGSGAASSISEDLRSSKPQSTLAQLLAEQKLQSANAPIKGVNNIVKKTPTYLPEPVPRLRVIISHREIQSRRRFSRKWISREISSATAWSPSRRSSRSTDPIIIKPLDEAAAEEAAALRRNLLKFGKFGAPPSETHGRRKKTTGRKSVRPPRNDQSAQSIRSASASGFEKQDCTPIHSSFRLPPD